MEEAEARALVNRLIKAACASAFKGAGHPADIPAIDAELEAASQAVMAALNYAGAVEEFDLDEAVREQILFSVIKHQTDGYPGRATYDIATDKINEMDNSQLLAAISLALKG